MLVDVNLENIGDFHVNDFLGKDFRCICGRVHNVTIERIIIGNGANKKIPQLLRDFNYKKVYLMADSNTYAAAGEDVEKLLQEAGFACKKLVYVREGELVPDERAAGEFLLNFDRACDVILAVGTGTINDLAKYMSNKLQVPYIVIATAPSMDGFASDGAALIVDNVKISYPVANPRAIVGDVAVLKKAPMNMLLAGLGDMVGKYTALRDWKLARIIQDEYYCDVVVKLVEASVKKCIDSADGLAAREDACIEKLMEGLVLTGIAMSFVGNSRPASGSEHHLSHFWEMMFLLAGKKAVLHGTKVGIATLVINRLTELLVSRPPDWQAIDKKTAVFDSEKWKEKIAEVYQKAAPGILRLCESSDRLSQTERLKRVAIIKANWGAITEALVEEPSAGVIESVLAKTGAPLSPFSVGIDGDMLLNSMLYGKEVRTRYTILQLLWDIGVLEEFATAVHDYYSKPAKPVGDRVHADG